MADTKVRCPVCGDSLKVKEGRLEEHKYKSGPGIACYGSHMPIYEDPNYGFSVGTVMHIPRGVPGRYNPAAPWNN
jgi:hypothetical protein